MGSTFLDNTRCDLPTDCLLGLSGGGCNSIPNCLGPRYRHLVWNILNNPTAPAEKGALADRPNGLKSATIKGNEMKQTSFFERIFGTHPKEMARTEDADTSHQAAEKIDSTKLEQMVYEVIAKHPNGCTSDEIMKYFPGHGVQTISPRYAPLLRKGYIYDTGERKQGSSGRSQRVMKILLKETQ